MSDANHWVRSGAADLAVHRAGKGAPVVFLHAGVCDKRMWRAQLAALGGDYRVIAYDRRGFGETKYERENHSPVDDLHAVLDSETDGRVALVGCSQGGRIAVDFALKHPERVSALVLIAPAITGAPEPGEFSPRVQTLVDAIEHAERAEDVERLNALEAHAWLDGPTSAEGRVDGEARALFLAMNEIALRAEPTGDMRWGESAYARLDRLSTPVMLVYGDLDFPHLIERCDHLRRTVPNLGFVELKGVAHLPSIERPHDVTRVLQVFLGRHSG